MAEYKWPEADKRTLIGKRISRIDGPHKVSGRAKYSYDINRPGMLFGKIVRSPARAREDCQHRYERGRKNARRESCAYHAGCRERNCSMGRRTSVVALAAVDEPTAEDAMHAIKVKYEMLPHLVTYEQT